MEMIDIAFFPTSSLVYQAYILNPNMTAASPFLVRDAGATEEDTLFIVSTFDSILPELDSIGSHEQWGSIPFSQRGDFTKETMMDLAHSEKYRLTGNSGANGLRVFIVEREYPKDSANSSDREISAYIRGAADGRRYLPVGFAYVRENWVPDYVKSQPQLQLPDTERDEFLYLEVMVTDTRVGSLRRGAGAALIRGIKDYARSRQKQALWVDSWAGNGRKLVKYVYPHLYCLL